MALKIRIFDEISGTYLKNFKSCVYFDKNGALLPQQNYFIIERYTGLNDKNGTGIYEGDICNTVTNKKMVVAWSNRFASFCLNRAGWAFAHWFGESCEPEECIVIGNINQHKDMLS